MNPKTKERKITGYRYILRGSLQGGSPGRMRIPVYEGDKEKPDELIDQADTECP